MQRKAHLNDIANIQTFKLMSLKKKQIHIQNYHLVKIFIFKNKELSEKQKKMRK
jgi:hypothetical protein